MKIAIIGSGGVGGYFGARLMQAGNDVSFVARGAQLKAMQTNGLHIKSILGDFKVKKVKATDRITAIKEPDLIILAVKAWQIKEIRAELNKILSKDTTILPLQNGVLAAKELLEVIDKKHVLGGLCRIISKIEEPGVIHHTGVTPGIVFGELDQSKTERIKNIQHLLKKAHIEARIAEDIEADLWKKFIAICVSGLLAVSNTTYGELRTMHESRQLMIELLQEIFLLSQKVGVKIEPDFIEKTVSFIDTFPYDSTSSLTRDVWAKRSSEIDYQNGTVVKLGEKYGVATPINRFVYHCLLPGEFKARGLRE